MTELLACPFCGSCGEVFRWDSEIAVQIRCGSCRATTAPFGDEATAADWWNDREHTPSEARLREMLCRVRDVIRYAANSEGGLAAEIDLCLGDGVK